jgi:hypothetical protein
MSPIEWLVILGGVAIIAWINWYFFLASNRVAEVTKEGSSWKRR